MVKVSTGYIHELYNKVKILYKDRRQESTKKGYILGIWLLGQQVFRAGIIDVSGITNIVDIVDIADIATDIADIINIADIADWML